MQERDIIKYLGGIATKSEQKQVEDWVTASDENLKKFNEVKVLYVVATFDETSKEVDIDKGYETFANAIRPKSVYRRLSPIYKYAAAASVLLVVALTIFLNKESEVQFTEPIIVNNNIEVGTDKAILTLESGEEVTLIKGASFQTQNATSNGEAIVYNKTASKDIAFNTLTIPRGGQYQITLADGTEVWLNSESQIKYPVAFKDGDTRQVELVYGEAYFDVSPSTDHKGSKFKVFNNAQEVEVLGTEFNIKAYKDENNIYTTLVEGKVAVSTTNANQTLVPNQQSNLDIATNSLAINDVNVKSEIAWINGEVILQHKNLKEIMKTLSRWYNMDVIFANKDLEEMRFVGVLGKDQSIIDILNTIKSFGIIKNYEINNKTITLK